MEKQAPKISILILTTNPKKYRLVMKQISQEGWAIATVGNIKKALQMIVTKKPSHVCLSVNFPGIPILKIAQLITTNFNTPAILFPEDFDFNTSKMIKEANWPNVMTVPMSGPALRSKIKLMLREAGHLDDTVEKESNLKTIRADRAQESNDAIEYNAPKKKRAVDIEEEGLDYSATKKKKFGLNAPDDAESDEGESYYQDPSGKKRRKKKIVNEAEEEADHEEYEEYVDAASGAKKRVPVFEEGSEDVAMEAGFADSDESSDDGDEVESYGFDDDTGDVGDMSEIDSILSAALGGTPAAAPAAPSLAEKIAANSKKAREEAAPKEKSPLAEFEEQLSGKKPSSAPKKNRKNEKDDFAEEDYEDGSTFDQNFVGKKAAKFDASEEEVGSGKVSAIDKKRKLSEIQNDEEYVSDEEFETRIERQKESKTLAPVNSVAIELDQLKPVKDKIQHSLDKCAIKSGKLENKVQVTTGFVAFLVVGDELNGIVYLAVGNDNAVGSGMTGVFLKMLSEDLRSIDSTAQCQKPVPIRTEGMNMRKWMLENCHFTMRAQHMSDEVLVGYIASEDVTPAFGGSVKKDMFYVGVEKFSCDFPVNVDLYIHLPKNDKLIRYLMPSGYLDPEQRVRLTQKDVTAFHVHNRDLVKLRDYFIEIFTKKRIAA